tara:strand:+ start:124 stop:327 length:204 start_codon:yes stop_codon:yes gene_type:complete
MSFKTGDIVKNNRQPMSRWDGHPMKMELFGIILRSKNIHCDVLWLNAETLIEPDADYRSLELINEAR